MSAKVYGKITVIKRNGSSGSQFPVTSSQCTFGRNADCEIRIQLPTVSERECFLNADENGNFVLSKANKGGEIMINDKTVDSDAAVRNNDVLTIAGRSFRFEYPPNMKIAENLVSASAAKRIATPKSSLIERVKQSHSRRVSFGPQLSPEQFASFLPPNTPVKKGAIPMQTLDNSEEQETEKENRRRSVLKDAKRRSSGKRTSPRANQESVSASTGRKRSFDELVALVGLDKMPAKETKATGVTKQQTQTPHADTPTGKKTPKRKSKQLTPQPDPKEVVTMDTKSPGRTGTPKGRNSVSAVAAMVQGLPHSPDLFAYEVKKDKTPKRRSKVNEAIPVTAKNSEESVKSPALNKKRSSVGIEQSSEPAEMDSSDPSMDDTVPYESPQLSNSIAERRRSKVLTPKAQTPARTPNVAVTSGRRQSMKLEPDLDATVPVADANPSSTAKARRSSDVKVVGKSPGRGRNPPNPEEHQQRRSSTRNQPLMDGAPHNVLESENAVNITPQDDTSGCVVGGDSDDTLPLEETEDANQLPRPTTPGVSEQERDLALHDTIPFEEESVASPEDEIKTPGGRRRSSLLTPSGKTPKSAGTTPATCKSDKKTPKSARISLACSEESPQSCDAAAETRTPVMAKTPKAANKTPKAANKTPKSANKTPKSAKSTPTSKGQLKAQDATTSVKKTPKADNVTPATKTPKSARKTPKSVKSTPLASEVSSQPRRSSSASRQSPRLVPSTVIETKTPESGSKTLGQAEKTPKSIKRTPAAIGNEETSVSNSTRKTPATEVTDSHILKTPGSAPKASKTPRNPKKSLTSTPTVVLTPHVTRIRKMKALEVEEDVLESTPRVTASRTPKSARKTPGTGRRKSILKKRQSILLSARKKRKSGVLLWSEVVKRKPAKELEKRPAESLPQQPRPVKCARRSMPKTPKEMRDLRHADSPATIYIGRSRRRSNLDPIEFDVSGNYSSDEDSYVVEQAFKNDIADKTMDFGTRNLMKTPKPEPVEDNFGIERLVKTPKIKGQAVENKFGTKRLLKTPVNKVKGQPVENNYGIQRLLATPKEKVKGQAVEEHFGTKRLMKTPKEAKGQAVENHFGTKRLLTTPKEKVKGQPVENHFGTKRLLTTPKEKVKGQPVVANFGTKRLMQTPKDKTKSEPVTENFGIAAMMRTPREKNAPVSDKFGTKRLLRSPKEKVVSTPVEDDYALDTLFGYGDPETDAQSEEVPAGGAKGERSSAFSEKVTDNTEVASKNTRVQRSTRGQKVTAKKEAKVTERLKQPDRKRKAPASTIADVASVPSSKEPKSEDQVAETSRKSVRAVRGNKSRSSQDSAPKDVTKQSEGNTSANDEKVTEITSDPERATRGKKKSGVSKKISESNDADDKSESQVTETTKKPARITRTGRKELDVPKGISKSGKVSTAAKVTTMKPVKVTRAGKKESCSAAEKKVKAGAVSTTASYVTNNVKEEPATARSTRTRGKAVATEKIPAALEQTRVTRRKQLESIPEIEEVSSLSSSRTTRRGKTTQKLPEEGKSETAPTRSSRSCKTKVVKFEAAEKSDAKDSDSTISKPRNDETSPLEVADHEMVDKKKKSTTKVGRQTSPTKRVRSGKTTKTTGVVSENANPSSETEKVEKVVAPTRSTRGKNTAAKATTSKDVGVTSATTGSRKRKVQENAATLEAKDEPKRRNTRAVTKAVTPASEPTKSTTRGSKTAAAKKSTEKKVAVVRKSARTRTAK